MQSVIIASKDKKKRDEHALLLCNKEHINKFDIYTLQFEKTEESSKSSIGIKEIREIQKNILLKPMQGSKKAIIISDAHLLTVEAQNALLKLLEEPPLDTLILLIVSGKDILLPTIISRCKVIQLKDGEEEKENKDSSVKDILLLSTGEKLKRAQDISKNKEEALKWLEDSIFTVREQLLTEIMQKEKIEKKYIETLKQLEWAHLTLSTTNANPRLVVENVLLAL